MTPRPIGLGLIVCEQVIVDRQTQNPSLINLFTGLGVDAFPSDPLKLSVFATLTGSAGSGIIEVRVSQVSTGQRIATQGGPLDLADRTDTINLSFRFRQLRFPAPGYYVFKLYVDGELLPEAQRRSRVYTLREQQ